METSLRQRSSSALRERVAVIGLGSTGIAALKNLREAGFDAVGFEKNPYIGGLWRYTADQQTLSVTKSTRTNVSWQRFQFTDFPWPKDPGNYPTAAEVSRYIDQYAEHFQLLPHCRLGLGIHKLDRSKDADLWDLTLKDKDGDLITEQFNRVLVTSGVQSHPVMPEIEGMEHFKSKIIHSIAFKEPKDYANQRVLLVGLSNTGGDIAAELSDVCPEIFVSHRSGLLIVNRTEEGKAPTDHRATRRANRFVLALNRHFPRFASYLANTALELAMKYRMKVQPEWKLLPAHPITNVAPVMNDHLVSLLRSGRVKSLPGVTSFSPDGHTATFSDNTTLSNIDTVIFCTGFDFDHSFLGDSANPFLHPTPEWDNHPNSNNMPYARLYRGLFSLDHPDSLAFIGVYRGHSISAFVNGDLASSAIAQIWRGHHALPARAEMDTWCDANYRAMLAQIQVWRTVQVGQSAKEFETFLNAAAGNGLNEKLHGWGWEAWRFMLGNWRLYRLLMDGIDTPFVYRLFESPRGEKGRKRWEGAEEAIWRTNGKSVPAKKYV
ncbi:uncharacterized protein HMPREF1541_04690 [Cyphellophora europaea CBS 101466]|uniref:FAD/NAD(P)-binding domain-containing protein n=1 Tax=Cyphellophora europaea (strain CBS 101466) TaxID=1220924 RepID=W2RXD4_CYPE1|nr:uncharacterized protein HMPREF1541_04690 [Cyphellophora europaea CBS 101466]ETN40413.1 hypothetical protein HMPREF1541_04690 [Cyphellophora europaea CBS 101466]